MKKTVIILEMILVFAITFVLFFLLEEKDNLLYIVKICSLTMLLYLSAQLRNKNNRQIKQNKRMGALQLPFFYSSIESIGLNS